MRIFSLWATECTSIPTARLGGAPRKQVGDLLIIISLVTPYSSVWLQFGWTHMWTSLILSIVILLAAWLPSWLHQGQQTTSKNRETIWEISPGWPLICFIFTTSYKVRPKTHLTLYPPCLILARKEKYKAEISTLRYFSILLNKPSAICCLEIS